MARIAPLVLEETSGPVRDAYLNGIQKYGHMTNMKRSLLHSLPSFHALMEWYPLLDTIKPFLGERLAIIFSHAISAESDCLICTTFMRRLLIDWGEDPNQLVLDTKGEVIVAFGRAIAQPGNRVSDPLYAQLAGFFTTEQIVALTAFASLMVATNIVNNVLEVDLDEHLYAYRDGQTLPHTVTSHVA
jgi:hypothetical protein